MFEVFMGAAQEEANRKVLAASVAARLFNEHRDADSVLVRIQAQAVPRLSARRRERSRWQTIAVLFFGQKE